ncbi:MAG: CheA signal transduction histidine kinase [Ignavibacteria bacterium]|nr:CheA signal transduction histidine kinase [Ignavibacteria bacterium]
MGAPLFNDPEMQEIFEGYLIETRELLDNLSQDLMIIEKQPDDLELINGIFRNFHTIKGTSSFMGFSVIAGITHHAEDILNKLRRNELKINLPIIDCLLQVHDIIEGSVESLRTGEIESGDFSEIINKIEELKNPGAAPDIELLVNEDTTGNKKDSSKKSKKDTQKSALDDVLTNQELVSGQDDFSEEELALIQAAFEEVNQQFVQDNAQVAFIQDSGQQVSQPEKLSSEPVIEKKPEIKQVEHSKTTNAPIAKAGAAAAKPASETIRIDVNRVETLMDLSGELVLGRNRLAQITDLIQLEPDNKDRIRELSETTAQIDFVTSEIQSAVMRMRMVPIGKLYQKAPRIVRDLAKEFNKKINLVVKGEETEIDRGIIEELNDPLVHMIRNSCDHGVESPEERVKIGKPEIGTITLDADQEGNNIVLRISDDGRGMDPEKLKAKAVEKGIITQEQASTMTSREAFQLIFLPGFSTAVKVSSVSGRGVGMDVVRTNIQNLKGMIEIDSTLGTGSIFIIKLPLTLAIIQGLLVRVKNETYALPLSSVLEVVAIDDESIYSINQQEVIRIRKEVLPLLRLDLALKVKDPKTDLKDRNVVVVGLGTHKIGIVVDDLLGQQEIVIKSLGEYLGSISGIAGSTILGDGRVIMIIDVTQLIQLVFSKTIFKM